MEVSGRGSHALESLTAHKITTFRYKYLPTMATGDNDDGDEDDDNNDNNGDGTTGDGIQR